MPSVRNTMRTLAPASGMPMPKGIYPCQTLHPARGVVEVPEKRKRESNRGSRTTAKHRMGKPPPPPPPGNMSIPTSIPPWEPDGDFNIRIQPTPSPQSPSSSGCGTLAHSASSSTKSNSAPLLPPRRPRRPYDPVTHRWMRGSGLRGG